MTASVSTVPWSWPGLARIPAPLRILVSRPPAVELGLQDPLVHPLCGQKGQQLTPAGGSPTALKVPGSDLTWVLACLPTAPSIEVPPPLANLGWCLLWKQTQEEKSRPKRPFLLTSAFGQPGFHAHFLWAPGQVSSGATCTAWNAGLPSKLRPPTPKRKP